jgi:hypothetical protein
VKPFSEAVIIHGLPGSPFRLDHTAVPPSSARSGKQCHGLAGHAHPIDPNALAVETRRLVDEFGRVGAAARCIHRPYDGVDVALVVAHTAEGHVLGELETKVITQVSQLLAADLLRANQALVGKIAPLGNSLERFHRSAPSQSQITGMDEAPRN